MLITLKSDIRPPTAPVLGTPAASVVGSLTVPLTTAATDVGGIASYSLERATSAGGTYSVISAAATFPYLDGSLSDGVQYYYRAQATDPSGNVGNYSAIVSQTTLVPDTTPNAFTFVAQTGVALGATVTSASVTISGINAAAPISVTGGMYSKNGGAFTASPGTVVNGDSIRAQHTASASGSTAVNTVVTIGGVSGTFTSTTTASTGPINVSTAAQLQAAVVTANTTGNRQIVLADGTYTLTDALYVNAANITIKSASGIRANVIVQGDAMSASAAVPFIVRTAAAGTVLEDITFGRCKYSVLQIVGESGANNGRVSRCAFRDSFEHLVKATTGAVTGSSNWIIEDCLFSFTAGQAPAQYNGGIDAHRAANWIIRRNTFQDIASPNTSACQHAVCLWNGGSGNLIERNKVIDCDRGLGSGLNASTTQGPAVAQNNDTIRNNMVYHSNNADAFADGAQIAVENSTNCKVYNNTVYLANSMPWGIEYRFTTTGAQITNNLTNKPIQARDGGVATLSNNVTNAQASYFVSPSTGDLSLASAVVGVADVGATLGTVTDDYAGTARPQGSGYDIGAYEYPVVSGNPLTLPLYDKTKITYLRKILVPNGGSSLNGGVGFQYGSRPGGIAFNAIGNGGAGSLFMSGGPESQPEVVCEFTIPLTNNARATTLQAFQLTAAGKQGQLAQGQLGVMCTGLMVYNSRLIESWCSFYSTDSMPAAYMARSSLTLSGGTATNPQRVGTLTNQRFMTGLGCTLPTNWQAVFGGYQAVGGGTGACSISSNYSCGPAMVLFNPDNLTGSGVVAGKELSWYELGDIDGGGSTQPFSTLWTNNSHHRGTIFLPESRTVLCFGKHGDSAYDNTLGGNASKVQVRTRFWLYDAVDLKRVYDGTLAPNDVLPYDTLDLNVGPNNSVPQLDEVRSCTWDPVGRNLYVMAGHEDGSFPAVFVFSIPV